MGGLSVVGGCITLMLPETMDQDLPQTMEDGENFGKDQKFWSFPCGKFVFYLTKFRCLFRSDFKMMQLVFLNNSFGDYINKTHISKNTF